jgi:DNA-directed RNA polymerase specialized sigma24 family protein
MNSSEDDTLWDTDRFNSSKIVDPWDPREIVDITEEDKPQWEVISKAIPLLDDIEQALVKSIMYKIPITKISKDTGIPESTLRSRKSRLLAKFRKNATKEPSLSVLYIGNKSSAKTGQAPTTKLDRRRPRNI